MTPFFERNFDALPGRAVVVAPGVRRVTASNAGAFTFTGTNSYLVGERSLALIDPGPADDAHFEALLEAIGTATVSCILVTHTHRDHSPLAGRLAHHFGAPVAAQGPHRLARPLLPGETNPFEASADTAFEPDIALADAGAVEGEGWRLRAVLTPGHTANHACFSLEGRDILFSGDHVMAWATTVVAPPDGAMGDYMRSLDKLILRDDRLLLPGHGGPVASPQPFLRSLRAHRRMREQAILARLIAGDRTIPQIVEALYRTTDVRLHGAAGFSVLAHLEDMIERGLASCEGFPRLTAVFAPGNASFGG